MSRNQQTGLIPDGGQTSKDDLRACIKCGSHELRRGSRSSMDRLLFLQPYHCARCKNRHKVMRIRWKVIPIILLPLAIIGAVTYFVQNPPSFSGLGSGGTAEADELAKTRTSMGGQLSAFEQILSRKQKTTLDNAAILRLWKANVGPTVITQMIRSSNGEYDISEKAIIMLREAQVDQSVILAMIDVTNRAH